MASCNTGKKKKKKKGVTSPPSAPTSTPTLTVKKSETETGCPKLETFISPSVDDRVKEFAEFEHHAKLGKTSDSIVYAVSVVDNETQRLKLIEDAQAEYSERRRVLKSQMERARSIYDSSRSQREVHEKLLKDAVHLEVQSNEEMERANKLVGAAAELRDEKLKEERALEIARAAMHEQAVEAEERRAQAQAQVLINKQCMHYAKFLQEKHAQEVDFMDALAKKQLMDLNELEARLNKVEFLEKHAETLIQGSLEYTPAEVDVEVGVQAQHIPSPHIRTDRPHGASLRTHIKEVLPPAVESETTIVSKSKEVSTAKERVSASHKEQTVSAR